MLIDSTYFRETNLVANIDEVGIVATPVNESLDHFIQVGERDVLSFAFGWEMWLDFESYITNGISPETPAHYLLIINGSVYLKNGKKCFWPGLIDPLKKESLLADYIYCIYRQDHETQTTGTGEDKIDSKIGHSVSIVPKVTRAWNQFIEKLHGGFRSNPSGYTPEGSPYWLTNNGGVDYYGINRKSGQVSLVQFLFDNKADYPLLDQNYRRFGEFKNELGI